MSVPHRIPYLFIETPQGHQILIDGGPDDTILEKLGSVLPFWDRDIDLVILTHPDKDHIAGLIDVLKRYKVEHVLWTGVEKDTQVFNAWAQALALENEEGLDIALVQTPQTITWSRTNPNQFMEILSPVSASRKRVKQTNDASIVAKLVFYKNSFLFTGDITTKIEKELVAKGVDIDVDMLKVAHHGSKSSSAEAFLAAVSPDVAVMQVGKENRYGHPHNDILSRFERLGIPVLRTDQNGDIVVRSNGSNLNIYYE